STPIRHVPVPVDARVRAGSVRLSMRRVRRLQAINHLAATARLKMSSASTLPATPTRFRLNVRITPLRLAAGLTLLALALRLIDLGSRPLWLDEAYSAWFSARGWDYLWSVVPTYEPHPPFYYSILKLWRQLFRGGDVAVRSLSVLFGVGTIPVLFAAASEQERQDPPDRPLLRASAAALLAALSPMLVILDQEVRPYPLLIFAYSIATLGLLRLLREFRAGHAGSWRSWMLLGVGTELSLWAHGIGILYAACVMVALLPAWIAGPFQRRRFIRGLA